MVLNIINGIVVVPVYFIFISKELFGAWLATGSILAWLTMIDPGTGSVVIQRISQTNGKKYNAALDYQMTSSLVVSFVCSFAALLVVLFGSHIFIGFLNLKESIPLDMVFHAMVVAGVATSLTLMTYSVNGILIGLNASKEAGTSLTIARVAGILSTILLLFLKCSILALAYGTLVTALVEISINIYYVERIRRKLEIRYRFNRKHLFAFSSIFTYTFFSRITTVLSQNLDLVLVSRFIGTEAVTMLEITRRPLKIINGFVFAPVQSVAPAFANIIGSGNKEKVYRYYKKFLDGYAWLCTLVFATFIAVNSSFIEILLGKGFFLGNIANLLICLCYIATAFIYYFENINFCIGNIKQNSVVEMSRSILSIGLLFVLLHFFNIYGLICAPFIAVVCTSGIVYPRSIRRFFKGFKNVTTFSRASAVFIVLSILLTTLIAFTKQFFPLWPFLFVALFCLSVYYAAITYFLLPEVWRIVKETIKNKKITV
jgi:O-antigen/teichoic acid export membrane protein